MQPTQALSNFLVENKFPISQLTSAEFYAWKVYNSPLGQGIISLEMDGDLVTASAALSPKPLLIHDEEILGAEIGDTFTHPDYRRKGLFSKKVKDCVQHGGDHNILLIYGTPNSQSLPGYEKKLGFPQCGNARVKDMFKEIDYDLVRSKMRRKISTKWLADSAAGLYWGYLQYKSKPLRANTCQLDWESAASFPRGINGRWAEQRKDYAFFMNRNSDYLNWRFIDNPNEYLIFIGRQNDAVRCFFVVKFKQQQDRLIGYICDYACWNDDPKMFIALLGKAEQVLKQYSAKAMELYCGMNSPYYGVLSRMGFRQAGDIPVIAYAASPRGKTLLESSGKWHFTMADADGV